MPDDDVAWQSLDILFKHEAHGIAAYVNHRLKLDLAPIAHDVSGDLPEVVARSRAADAAYMLQDDRLLHFEFQATTASDDLQRFLEYDVALVRRHDVPIVTVVIYGPGVSTAPHRRDRGAVQYEVAQLFLSREDGVLALAAAREELAATGTLSEEGRVGLIFAPLMRHSVPLEGVLREAVGIAQQLPEDLQRAVAGGLAVLGKRMLEPDVFRQFVEGLMGTKLGHPLLDQRYEEGVQEGELRAHRQDIMNILAARQISVPAEFRTALDRITSLDALGVLLREAAVATDGKDFVQQAQAHLPSE